MEFLDSYEKLEPQAIEVAEGKLGISFPDEYKAFLLEHNGGRPTIDGILHEGEHFDYVGYFYAIRTQMDHDDLVRKVKENEEMIPKGYLSIGESPGGDVFCISLKSDSYGSIFHWDHEEANYDGEPWEYNMTKLANSLGLFLKGLYPGV